VHVSQSTRRVPVIPITAGARYVVMRDGSLAVDEVIVVLGIKDGDADVLPREGLDVGPRRPPADRHDFRPAVTKILRPHLGPEIAWRLLIRVPVLVTYST
jgi:hypothetical protein